MQRDLGGAISGNKLMLYYRPQARIGGEIFGFKALVRWCHQERRLPTRPRIPERSKGRFVSTIKREEIAETVSRLNPRTVAYRIR